MAERMQAYWRVCAAGLCFSSFGFGGLLLRLLVFPLLRVSVRGPHRRAIAARWVIHHLFRAFVALMCRLGVISFEVRGLHKLQRSGLLIVANHPTLIDVVFLVSFISRANCIVKAALAHNPFTRGPVRAAGFVCNDSGPAMVDDCIASVRAGDNLIVFPEGTRTPRNAKPRLQRGAANVALRGHLAITPVRVRVTPPMLGKGDKWYRVPPRRAHFVFEVGDDIDARRFVQPGESDALAARRLTAHLTDHFFPETPRAAA
jgi:1-acyl-sn-glycerol-3-phosphate acyltransferase